MKQFPYDSSIRAVYIRADVKSIRARIIDAFPRTCYEYVRAYGRVCMHAGVWALMWPSWYAAMSTWLPQGDVTESWVSSCWMKRPKRQRNSNNYKCFEKIQQYLERDTKIWNNPKRSTHVDGASELQQLLHGIWCLFESFWCICTSFPLQQYIFSDLCFSFRILLYLSKSIRIFSIIFSHLLLPMCLHSPFHSSLLLSYVVLDYRRDQRMMLWPHRGSHLMRSTSSISLFAPCLHRFACMRECLAVEMFISWAENTYERKLCCSPSYVGTMNFADEC